MDTKTGAKVGEYKTRSLAEEACFLFEHQGVLFSTPKVPPHNDTAESALEKRMQRPDGDLPPSKPRHSSKRPVELD